MTINVNLNTQIPPIREFANVSLSCPSLRLTSQIDLNCTALLDYCNHPAPLSIDFLFISAIIYCVDKLISRRKAIDNWTRELNVEIPVHDSELWANNALYLNSAISFLTGDLWNISFTQLNDNLFRPNSKHRERRSEDSVADIVSLFSGGLDSLIGAIDLLENHPDSSIKLVGHYDPDIGGPKADQNRLISELINHYGNRLEFVQVRAGQNPSGKEITFRSRSILFIALGMYVASNSGESIDLFMPENGNIALNIPLTPSRRGSNSTRTAHPFFLHSINKLLQSIGYNNKVINPFELKTKGECVDQCLNTNLLRRIVELSTSCAKSHHRRTWIRRGARQCGRCMPCIYRRAALHKIDIDNEVYGHDICRGEVDLFSEKKISDDFRAIVSFISKGYSKEDISAILLSNGILEVSKLNDYSDLVLRASEEVRYLFRDNA